MIIVSGYCNAPVENLCFNHFLQTGSFLILKKDAQSGDPLKHPCIWKIDGKALLQKFEPFEEDGKIKHRNTSIVRIGLNWKTDHNYF